MSSGDDDIDPSWWTDVIGDANETRRSVTELSADFQRAANQDGLPDLQAAVLNVLAVATSPMLDPANWSEPFAPAMVWNGRRSQLPIDLDGDQLTLLARLAPSIGDRGLRARVADIAWFYGDRANVHLMEVAVDAYRAAPLTGDGSFGDAFQEWRRAFELVHRRGNEMSDRLVDMTATLQAVVLDGNASDGHSVVESSDLLRSHGRVPPADRAGIADKLARLASDSEPAYPHLARAFERESVAWQPDPEKKHEATERVARSYLTEADARIAADARDGSMAEGHFVEKALTVYRGLPRSYRLANGIEDLIRDLRERLRDCRETVVENMSPVRAGPFDPTEILEGARQQVTGATSRFDALTKFVGLVPALDADKAQENARAATSNSIRHHIGSETFAHDGRKVAAREGGSRTDDDPAVDAQIVEDVGFRSSLSAQAVIMPALRVLTLEHRFDRDFFARLCEESPTVPAGHAALWAVGLDLGMAWDFGPAVAVLVPQLEQAIRALLKQAGAYVYSVNAAGAESEKSLPMLLAMPETTEIFGSGFVLEVGSLFATPGGPNLRNAIAHGLLRDGKRGAHTRCTRGGSAYAWWCCRWPSCGRR